MKKSVSLWVRLCLVSVLMVCVACTSSKDKAKEKPGAEAADKAEATAASKKETKAEDKADKTAGEVVVYSGRSSSLVGPLFEKFEAKTGIKVKTRYEKSTQALANRIALEGAQTQADVFFAQDSGYLGALAKKGLLAALPKEVLERVPANRKDGEGHWVASSGRARVLVYSPERVKAEELPKTLFELTDAKWAGRMGWAPSNSSYQAHVSALRALWGEEKTREWLEKIAANKPKVYPKNSPQVKAVSNGEIDVGWVNHYYLHKLKAANRDLKAANHSFTEKGDAGNVLMLSGLAVTKAARNAKNAQALVAFLLSDEAQNYFAQKVYEYPTVAGIKTHADVPALPEAWATVDQSALADVAGTIKLLRAVKLQ